MPPWANKWLLGGITLSMILHCFILYLPWAALLFSVEPLDKEEWMAVLIFSFPVILIDEVLKAATRYTAFHIAFNLLPPQFSCAQAVWQ